MPCETIALARFLIGRIIVHDLPEGRVSGRIVETEAYAPGDPSSHAYRGPTARNASMFLERGRAYVYFIYGSSYCLNISSEERGIGAAVLLRALEPLEGIPLMRRRRKIERLYDLCRGPGRLTQALGVAAQHDGVDMLGFGPLRVVDAARPQSEIGQSVRIGLSREVARLERFYELGSAFVSGPKALNRVLPPP